MKPLRLNKVIGLAVGEQSLLAAEVAATAGGKPEVRQVAELRYPDGVTPAQPAELGAALAAFLRDNKFTAKSAVVGLPARWLIVKPKDVPPADPATLAELLRLQAEGEFSSELKDLVYDYAADATEGKPKSVLLIATPQRYVDGAVALCEAAKLTAVAVTPSVVALGAATATADKGNSPIVMTVGPNGAELTAQAGAAPSAIRYLRGPAVGGDPKPFLGELRRTVSTLPVGINGATRQMVLWGSDADVTALNGNLGFPVRAGDLPSLGVTASGAAANGDGRPYAAAVALALSAMGDVARSVDFLHPRLAAPKVRRIPRWAVSATLAVILVIIGSVLAYNDLQRRQGELDQLNKDLTNSQRSADTASAFVNMVAFAKGWRGGTPRYLACLADLTAALPQDGETYATNLSLREPPRPTGAAAAAAQGSRANEVVLLIGHLEGKTSDQNEAQQVLDRLKQLPAFHKVQSTGSQLGTGRDRAVTFSITFVYELPKATDAPAHR